MENLLRIALLKTVNATGMQTDYRYDDLNRLLAAIEAGVNVAGYSHDNDNNINTARMPLLSQPQECPFHPRLIEIVLQDCNDKPLPADGPTRRRAGNHLSAAGIPLFAAPGS